MICNDSALQRLEYPRMKQLLAGQTQSEPGRLDALQLLPAAALADVEMALAEVDEAVSLLEQGQSPALGGCCDSVPIVARAQAEGSIVGADDLLKISESLRAMADCRRWFEAQADENSVLGQLAAGMINLTELQRRLQDSIGSRGELLDSASFELGDLRYQIRQLRSRIKQQLDQLLTSDQYGSFFQERLITQRNGRYVVPLKSDCRGQLKGFIQDESASGQTLYLEPTRVLDDNNRLQQLLREEQREERRILLQLAGLIRRDGPQLLDNQKLLARIDVRFASARLSQAYGGCRPQLAAAPMMSLKQARHPLIMEREGRFDLEGAVAIDLLLPADRRALVISGPNTGGKSVALKTAGLLLLMLRSGLHIPCNPDSEVFLFSRIHVDIGDEQSIEQSLSTFSGHLLKVRQILEQADENSLVLLDEAGSGTDPAEGAALIQAVLDRLCRLGARTLVTTHLGQLKHFAHGHPDIDNVAVEFDPQTLAPTYRLCYGIPGASSALTTARRLGLPDDVLRGAVNYLGSEEHDHSALLTQLNNQRQELDQQLELAKKSRLDAETAQQLRKQQLQQLKEKKREIISGAVRQAEELISATEAQMKALRKQKIASRTPQEAVENKSKLQQAREDLRPFKAKNKRSANVPQELRSDELVRIVPLAVEARVVKVNGKNVELLVGGKRMRQPLTALEQYQPRRFAEEHKRGGQVSRTPVEKTVSSQLKLIGLRTDDALSRLESFLDDALLHNLSRVEIVHGAGEGILRRAVRDCLAQQKGITAFYAAPAGQGGDNVTIAELET